MKTYHVSLMSKVPHPLSKQDEAEEEFRRSFGYKTSMGLNRNLKKRKNTNDGNLAEAIGIYKSGTSLQRLKLSAKKITTVG